MRLCDIEKIPELAGRPILREKDPNAVALMNPDRAGDIAEAADTIRLFDLIHRNKEYRPLAIVCFRENRFEDVKVYFARLQCGDE